jgi:hypothetical protein
MTVASPLTLVAFALPAGMAAGHPDQAHWQQALNQAFAPTHSDLWRQAQRVTTTTLPDSAMSARHEVAWAQALGWQVDDGLVPLAALAAQAQGWHCPADHGWAFIDAVHWHISQGQVNLSVPHPITAEETQALGDAMQPFLLQDGIHLQPLLPGRWLAHAPVFKHLSSVSLDRVNGQRIDHWLQPSSIAAQTDAERLLRRLQNEMQMLFYTHAVNDHRAVALNSVWFSGTGELPPMQTHSDSTAVVLDQSLREVWLSHDPEVFVPAFQAVLHNTIAPALARHEQVLLCDPTRSVLLENAPQGLRRKLQQWLRPTQLSDLLL